MYLEVSTQAVREWKTMLFRKASDRCFTIDTCHDCTVEIIASYWSQVLPYLFLLNLIWSL